MEREGVAYEIHERTRKGEWGEKLKAESRESKSTDTGGMLNNETVL